MMATHLYERIVDKIETSIKERTFQPGDRIPSVRKLSVQERVSMSTVLQAYFALEDKGLIEARPQSGYYVRMRPMSFPAEPRISAPREVPTKVEMTELVLTMQDALNSPNTVPFGSATPDPHLLPINKLNRLIASISRREGMSCHEYDFTQGNEELRRHIARRSLESGCTMAADDIIITCGCTEALNLCLRAVANPGDTIAVESPTFFGILQIIESLNMKVLEIPTDPRDGICLESLHRALRKQKVRACLVIPNYQNPLGSCMPESNKKELVSLLARKGIPLIEDDIYGDLHFGIHRPSICKAYDHDGLVLTCSSFSKTLSPGFRVGWVVPGKFKTRVQQLKLTNTLSGSVLPQMVLAEMLRNGGYDHHLRKIRRAYATHIERITHAISKYFPAGTNVTRPQGGFVLWIEMPQSIDALDLYRRSIKKGISVLPGVLFSAKRQYKNFIRLNCSNAWSDKLNDALMTLGELAKN